MLHEFLLRFRGAGVPGASAGAGAPADPAATLDAELAPMFALLDDCERKIDALEADAQRQAEQFRTHTTEQVRTVLVDARARVSAEQAAEAAARFASADKICVEVETQTAKEAARIESLLPERIPPLVKQLVERILDDSVTAHP